jgi:hypothetical protein
MQIYSYTYGKVPPNTNSTPLSSIEYKAEVSLSGSGMRLFRRADAICGIGIFL